jgi:hypothetical protein
MHCAIVHVCVAWDRLGRVNKATGSSPISSGKSPPYEALADNIVTVQSQGIDWADWMSSSTVWCFSPQLVRPIINNLLGEAKECLNATQKILAIYISAPTTTLAFLSFFLLTYRILTNFQRQKNRLLISARGAEHFVKDSADSQCTHLIEILYMQYSGTTDSLHIGMEKITAILVMCNI